MTGVIKRAKMKIARNMKKCDIYRSDQKCIRGFIYKNKGKTIFDEFNYYDRIILKVCLDNYDVTVWTERISVCKETAQCSTA